jgi:hypothetical protein
MRKTRNRETRHNRGVHPGDYTVCTVCTSRRLRARGRLTVQMSHLEQQFLTVLDFTYIYYFLIVLHLLIVLLASYVESV